LQNIGKTKKMMWSTEAEWTFGNLETCHGNGTTLLWQHGQSRSCSVDIDKSQGLSAGECSMG